MQNTYGKKGTKKGKEGADDKEAQAGMASRTEGQLGLGPSNQHEQIQKHWEYF
jgi:hypothetical protein